MDIFVFFSEQWLLVSIFLGLLYIFLWREKAKSGKGVSVHGLSRLLNSGNALLIDVRDSSEFSEGHIVDAMNIPHNKIDDHLSELANQKDKTLIVADKMGQHAGFAGRKLAEAGFDVYRLEGGMAEWKNQNLPVVK